MITQLCELRKRNFKFNAQDQDKKIFSIEVLRLDF